MPKVVRGVVFAAAGVLAVPTALAQSAPPPPAASQVTPRDLRPDRDSSGAPTAVAPRAGTAPTGSDELSFRPSRIVVRGGYAVLQRQTDAAVAGYVGRPITVADFYELGNALQRLYVGAGYPLARIVVPAQSLTDGGEASFELIDGVVGELDVSGVPQPVRAAVLRRLQPLIGRRQLRGSQIERRLLLAGQVPGAALRSALAPGRQPGTTTLVIEADYRPISGGLNFDDLASPAFNRRNLTLRLAVASVFGQGEQLYVFAASDPLDGDVPFSRNHPRSVVGGGVSLPIGHDGLQLNLEATHSRTKPLGGFFVTRNTFNRGSVRISYPVVLDRRLSLTAQASIEALREVQVLPQFDDFALSKDRFLVSRIGGQIFATRGRLALSGDVTFSIGRGFPSALTPYSRGAATDRFARVEGGASATIELPARVLWANSLRGAAVIAGGLPNSELFQLDGPSALSTFTSGTLSADQGVTLRSSLSRPLPVANTLAVVPYLFAAGGIARNTVPTAFDTRRAAAYGLGITTDLRFPRIRSGIVATLEYGRGVTDNPFLPDRNRFSVQLGLRF